MSLLWISEIDLRSYRNNIQNMVNCSTATFRSIMAVIHNRDINPMSKFSQITISTGDNSTGSYLNEARSVDFSREEEKDPDKVPS